MGNFTLCTIFRIFGVFYIKSKGSNDPCMFFLFFLNNLGLFFLSYPGQFGNHTHTHSLTSVQLGLFMSDNSDVTWVFLPEKEIKTLCGQKDDE